MNSLTNGKTKQTRAFRRGAPIVLPCDAGVIEHSNIEDYVRVAQDYVDRLVGRTVGALAEVHKGIDDDRMPEILAEIQGLARHVASNLEAAICETERVERGDWKFASDVETETQEAAE
jgi:hypothetical protein